MGARFTEGFYRMIPEGTATCSIETRQHRGQPVYAVVCNVPHGPSIVLNGYYDQQMAIDAQTAVVDRLAIRKATL